MVMAQFERCGIFVISSIPLLTSALFCGFSLPATSIVSYLGLSCAFLGVDRDHLIVVILLGRSTCMMITQAARQL
jgi:hypothetical protein